MRKITLGLAALSMTFASAQQLSTTADLAHTIQPVSDAVLYDQQDDAVTQGIINLFNNDEDFGVWATDDFELSTAADLGVITAYGFNNDGAALINITGVSLYIYSNVDGINIPDGDPTLPGSGVVELIDIPAGTPGLEITPVGDMGGLNISVDVSALEGETVTLPAGSYWLVITPNMDGQLGLPAAARWNQYGAGTGAGFGVGNAHLIDPSNAFGGGFTSWTDYAALGLDFFSTAFTVEGEENLSLYSNVKEAVSVYPNPAVNVINLQMPSVVEIKSATIFNLLGQEIQVRVTNNQIDVSDLAQGVHILKLETNQGSISRKFVKK
jgi:hypothetical protein